MINAAGEIRFGLGKQKVFKDNNYTADKEDSRSGYGLFCTEIFRTKEGYGVN